MDELISKKLDAPDERFDFPGARMDVVSLGGATLTRFVFEPGWRWTDDMPAIAGTPTCQAPHSAYVVSGRLAVQMDDGRLTVAGPGEAIGIPPGHDAWVEGDEACVLLDWSAAAS